MNTTYSHKVASGWHSFRRLLDHTVKIAMEKVIIFIMERVSVHWDFSESFNIVVLSL